MITLLRREFSVNLPLEEAWRRLALVAGWPSWARHIKHVTVQPPGELGAQSTGHFHLRNGVKCAFSMTEFNPHRNWKWAGPFLWLTVHYDHRFEAQEARRTKFVWIIEAQGFGASTLGRFFAMFYKGSLDRAIPALIEELNAANR